MNKPVKNPNIRSYDIALRKLRYLIKRIGFGFHPDTPGADYVDINTNERSFDDGMARYIDLCVAYCHDILGDDLYDHIDNITYGGKNVDEREGAMRHRLGNMFLKHSDKWFKSMRVLPNPKLMYLNSGCYVMRYMILYKSKRKSKELQNEITSACIDYLCDYGILSVDLEVRVEPNVITVSTTIPS